MTTTRIRSTVVDAPDDLRCKTCGGPVREVYVGDTSIRWFGHLNRPTTRHYINAIPTPRTAASAPQSERPALRSTAHTLSEHFTTVADSGDPAIVSRRADPSAGRDSGSEDGSARS